MVVRRDSIAASLAALVALAALAPTPSLAEPTQHHADTAVPAHSLPVPGAPADSTAAQSLSTLDVLKLRDPFKRALSRQSLAVPREPLERYPTSTYKMIGVLTGPDHYRAVLLDPDGQTHIVAAKMKIGPNGGHITKITSDEILVKERVANILGQIEEVTTTLDLVPESKRLANPNESLVRESTQVVGVQQGVQGIQAMPEENPLAKPPTTLGSAAPTGNLVPFGSTAPVVTPAEHPQIQAVPTKPAMPAAPAARSDSPSGNL